MWVYIVLYQGGVVDVFSTLAGAQDFITNIIAALNPTLMGYKILTVPVNVDVSPSTNVAYKAKKGVSK